MVWSGFKEYQRRKQEAAQQHRAANGAWCPTDKRRQPPRLGQFRCREAQPQPLKGKPALRTSPSLT